MSKNHYNTPLDCECMLYSDPYNDSHYCLACTFGDIYNYYVYLWLRPDGRVFYVGKGSHSRCVHQHIRTNGDPAPCELERRKHPYIIVQIVEHRLKENKAYLLEDAVIEFYKDEPLTNTIRRPAVYEVTSVEPIAEARIYKDRFTEQSYEDECPRYVEVDIDEYIENNFDLFDAYEPNDETDIRISADKVLHIIENDPQYRNLTIVPVCNTGRYFH